MREISDWYGEDGGNEGHGKENDRHDGEDHNCLALSTCESSLISCEPGFKCIRMFLLKVEEVGELQLLAWHPSDGSLQISHRSVNAIGLFVHPFNILQVDIDYFMLFAKPLVDLRLSLLVLWSFDLF